MGSSGYSFGLEHLFMMMMIVALVIQQSAAQNSTCGLRGSNCEIDSQCCSGKCRHYTGRRYPKGFSRCDCIKAGNSAPCTSTNECCFGSHCVSSRCKSCGIREAKCSNHSECCSGFCTKSGRCKQCTLVNARCNTFSDCCPESQCSGSICTPCALPNASCTTNLDCCTGTRCFDSVCSVCGLNGSCTEDSDCCPPFGCEKVRGSSSGTCRRLNLPETDTDILHIPDIDDPL